MPAQPFLSAESVRLQFPGGALALEELELSIEQGEFVALVGPSGCGKSTLLRLVAGLLEPTAGRLVVDGLSPVQARRDRHQLAFVFQDANLLPWRRVAANVRLPLELQGLRDEGRVREALELVGLADFHDAFPHQLSGGMRMRVSLARALVLRPALLLLDEPFGALDEITRQRLNEELLRVWADRRWTGLFVTHNVFEAVFLAQRVLVISPRPGRVVADLRVPFPHPRSPDLRAQSDFAQMAGEVSRLLREGER